MASEKQATLATFHVQYVEERASKRPSLLFAILFGLLITASFAAGYYYNSSHAPLVLWSCSHPEASQQGASSSTSSTSSPPSFPGHHHGGWQHEGEREGGEGPFRHHGEGHHWRGGGGKEGGREGGREGGGEEHHRPHHWQGGAGHHRFFHPSFLSLRSTCAHIPAITSEELAARRTKVAKETSSLGYRAYLTEPGASMRYLSNVAWKLSERPFLLVIPVDQPHFFISPKFEEGKASQLIENGTALYTWEEDESPYDLVYRLLGSPSSSFALAIDPDVRLFIQDGLEKAFGAQNTLVSALEIVRNTRGIKSKAEVDILRCANQVTKQALALVAGLVYEGMTEDVLAALVAEALKNAGLTNVWHLVLFAENAAYPHGTSNKIPLEKGHLILIDAGGELHGYQSDITRTFSFGGYAEWQADMWATVRRAQQAALEAIRIGAPMGDVDKAARDVVTASGYGEGYETFTHRLGHGIGLQGHEEMYAVKGNDYPITPGMCFSVEPGIYIIGKGGVRIEDIVCATSTAPYYELFGPTSDTIDDPFKDH